MDIVNQNKDRNKRRKSSIDLSTMVYGKLPPQARDLEESVLGACMIEKDAFQRIFDIVNSNSFYVDGHQKVFSAIEQLYDKRKPIDLLMVIEQLKESEELDMVGGPYYVTKLTNSVISAAAVEAHARIVQQKFIARETIRICGDLINFCYEEDHSGLFQMLDAGSEAFYNLQANVFASNMKSFAQLMLAETNELDNPTLKEGVTGIPTGFRKVDRTTAGWQPTDLIILAARPSMGKTALAANFAFRSAAIYGVPTLFFSLEMNGSKIIKRIISAETDIPMYKSLHNYYDKSDKDVIREFADTKSNVPLYMDDNANQTINSICAISRKEKKKRNLGLIIIDYIQLIGINDEFARRSGNRDQDLGIITRALKQLAKEIEVPVIALSQLSRAAEQKEEERPQLRHLRESGNIEQDADVVMFLYRAYYYAQRKNPNQLIDPQMMKAAELIFAKHRNGPLETIDLIFEEKFACFKDEDDLFNGTGYAPYRREEKAELYIQKGNWRPIETDDEESPI